MAGKGDDRDKTVIGGALPPVGKNPFAAQPPAPQGDSDPFAVRAPLSRPAAPTPAADRTMIGGPLPVPPAPAQPYAPQQPYPPQQAYPPQQPYPAQQPYAPQGGRMAPTGQAGGFGLPGPGLGPPPGASGDTWLGGPLPPAQAPGYAPTPYGAPQHSGFGLGSGGGIGQPAGGVGQGFFPDIPRTDAHPQPRMQAPRISLRQALQATGLGKGGSANPLVAAAANLLILFGRLRTGMVEMEAVPLMEHVTREIDAFERNALASGVSPQEATVAKYALCGTADDIVQNLPGADRGLWIQYSMAARFFQTRDTGVGFFQEAEKAMQAPAQYYNLLELMLTCLSLGFEGQYRTAQNGSTTLARIRHAMYETLRRVRGRPDEDLSVTWLPVLLGGRRRFGGVPVWAFGGIAAVILVGFFATLSTLINKSGAAAAETLYTLHPTAQKVALERVVAGPAYVAPVTGQLERIRTALAPEIAQGAVEVGEKGDFIFVRVGNLLLFNSGQATVKPEFGALGQRISEVLNTEPGPIRILGYTDNVQPSGRGRFKTNIELSVARAEGVRDVIASQISNPERIVVEGLGEADPIADNATQDGQARNRRVEVLMAREGTF